MYNEQGPSSFEQSLSVLGSQCGQVKGYAGSDKKDKNEACESEQGQ